jgi:hypothetical protein
MLPSCDLVPVLCGRRRRGVAEGGEALAEGVEGCLGAAAEVQLGEDVADVGAHGGFADGQAMGNLHVVVSLGHETENLDLPVRLGTISWPRR